ncbi:MAG TPA: alanine/ornithine racemase family PLP-dependent enzyme, partial [Acidimicrobiales bacterium]|nr:alanine/ornithine racemase family PLP-dependent enzyme [Acidimicrobiales bacterium]
MTAPRLEVRLDLIERNTRTLVDRLAPKGIAVHAVTKAALGSPAVARAFIAGGAAGLADSRAANGERLRAARIRSPILSIRSPMVSEADRIVRTFETSANTEHDVITALSAAASAHGWSHGVLLMVELGDLREGILPRDVEVVARHALSLPSIELRGIGSNLACRSGVIPDDANMAELSDLATSLERSLGVALPVVSGGNSANLTWALATGDTGRINHLRLGEALLLGCEPLERRPVDGLSTDAFSLVAEVIESKVKPVQPWGELAQTAFGERPRRGVGGNAIQTIVALGRQDVDAGDLTPPAGAVIVASSSDHLVLETDHLLRPGTELAFRPGYAALLRAMT